jgi:cGMP-specific 3',5'-cyclic phosphodiesterase
VEIRTRQPQRRAAQTMDPAGPSVRRPWQQQNPDSVEAWLDDHWDFTFSYFVRKATR